MPHSVVRRLAWGLWAAFALAAGAARGGEVEARGSFELYEQMRLRLAQGTIGLRDLPYARPFFVDPGEADAFASTLRSLATADTDGRKAIQAKLYEQFVRATPHPEVLYDYLWRATHDYLRLAEADDDKRAAYYAWSWGYAAEAAVWAYRATRQERFLGLVVSTFHTIVGVRDCERDRVDTAHGRVMRAWGNRCYGRDGQWSAEITSNGRILDAALQYCEAVKADPALDEVHSQRAAAYLRVAEQVVGEFREDFRLTDGGQAGYFVRRSHGDTEPLNHQNAFGSALVRLHGLTGKAEYRDMAAKLARFFLAATVRESNGSYSWGYWPTPEKMTGHPGEGFMKGMLTVRFPLLAHRHGIVIERGHAEALAATFLRSIHRGELRFNAYVSSTRTVLLGDDERMRRYAHTLLGWIVVEEVDPRVRTVLEEAVARRRDLLPEGWLSLKRPIGSLAYARRMTPLPRPPGGP